MLYQVNIQKMMISARTGADDRRANVAPISFSSVEEEVAAHNALSRLLAAGPFAFTLTSFQAARCRQEALCRRDRMPLPVMMPQAGA